MPAVAVALPAGPPLPTLPSVVPGTTVNDRVLLTSLSVTVACARPPGPPVPFWPPLWPSCPCAPQASILIDVTPTGIVAVAVADVKTWLVVPSALLYGWSFSPWTRPLSVHAGADWYCTNTVTSAPYGSPFASSAV